ncbi:glycosyltransferase [Microcoleus sp. FACHB-1515]|uniref:glycosyltransferase family 2 protein n=1 Tax=Cyanophyceae TaxID=3028117 RepID=UPI001688A8F6|nr:glycosyltransferase [Microcoleus sp. FACHB-1515]MBD2089464.1 glycosyltransferase [Microcoleus sp. FACHB-1515]
MPYAIVHLEVTQPLPTLNIPADKTGVALIVRRHDKPIGLLLKALPAPCAIAPAELADWLAQDMSAKLLQERLHEELALPDQPVNFPSLTVAICTKDRPDSVERLLRSLLPLQQTSQFEILVVDNAPSDDRTQTVVAAFASVCYVREPKAGLDFARNCALQTATGELLAFLDDDVVVDRQWLNGLREAWAENPDAAAFTGLVLPYELETEAQILFEQRGGFRRGFEKIRYGQYLPNNVEYPCGSGIFGAGCNMAFRRDVLRAIGGFDDALDTGAPLPGGGDIDIFYRIIRAGYPLVYEPRYLVFHQHRRELKQLRRQYWSWGLGVMAFVTKSYRCDASQRSKLLRLIAWWYKDKFGQLLCSFTTSRQVPPVMILAELWGGVVGLLGEYDRSCDRVNAIRSQYE